MWEAGSDRRPPSCGLRVLPVLPCLVAGWTSPLTFAFAGAAEEDSRKFS